MAQKVSASISVHVFNISHPQTKTSSQTTKCRQHHLTSLSLTCKKSLSLEKKSQEAVIERKFQNQMTKKK